MSGEGNRKEGPKASVSLTCLHPMFLASHPHPRPAVPTLRAMAGVVGVCVQDGRGPSGSSDTELQDTI